MTNMRRINILFGFIIFCGFHSCKSNKSPDELKVIFYQNKAKLDLFANTIQNERKLDSIFSNRTEEQGLSFHDIKRAYPNIYNSLIESGIVEASSNKKAYPKSLKWYWLKTNWPNEYPIYLAYDTFDSLQTAKGYYNKDEALNETWGLGGHWFMFRWVKDKPYKQ